MGWVAILCTLPSVFRQRVTVVHDAKAELQRIVILSTMYFSLDYLSYSVVSLTNRYSAKGVL